MTESHKPILKKGYERKNATKAFYIRAANAHNAAMVDCYDSLFPDEYNDDSHDSLDSTSLVFPKGDLRMVKQFTTETL